MYDKSYTSCFDFQIFCLLVRQVQPLSQVAAFCKVLQSSALVLESRSMQRPMFDETSRACFSSCFCAGGVPLKGHRPPSILDILDIEQIFCNFQVTYCPASSPASMVGCVQVKHHLRAPLKSCMSFQCPPYCGGFLL